MASFYQDVEVEWRDDGIDRAPTAGDALGGEDADRRRGVLGRGKLRRIFPLAIFLAGVLMGKAF
jgi:hypothetical protein